MLLLESTFDAAECAPTPLADTRSALSHSPDQDRPEPNSTLADVARSIEAEIPFLRRTVRRWHREAADADDLVQDTLLRALANAHLWEPGSNLRAWLATIMRNQFLANVSRARRSKQALEMLDIADSAPANVEARLTLRDVDRAYQRLPNKQRSAVFLAGVEGKSYSEAAVLMGMTADAVRCHLARARDRLRTSVYKHGDTSWIRRTVS
jgi:RNA polymerase sigma-70 factor (ECF subfamily)